MANAVKKVGGIAQANIKKIMGVVIASVKKIMGVINEVEVADYTFADMTVTSAPVTEDAGVITMGNGACAYSNDNIFDDCFMQFTVTETIDGITFHMNDADQSPFGSENIIWIHGTTTEIRDGWGGAITSTSVTWNVDDVCKITVVGTTVTVYKNAGLVLTAEVSNKPAGYLAFRNSQTPDETIKDFTFNNL